MTYTFAELHVSQSTYDEISGMLRTAGYHHAFLESQVVDMHGLAISPLKFGTMDFGAAIRALKEGRRVARAGWNGKGMWLALSCGETRKIPAESFWSPHNAEHARQQGGKAKVLPSITMKTATGEILMGWLASQTDMLAEDWQIVLD